MLPGPEYTICSQGVPAGIRAEIKQSVEGREFAGEYLCDPLEMEARRLWQVVCCRAGDETGEFDLEERRDK